MRSEFREIVANGDLLLQKRSWWLFGDKFLNYRNLSEESRLLKEHMDQAYMRYKELQRLYIIASKNVQTDTETIGMYKIDNSEVEVSVPSDFSILEERDGIKYSFSKGNSSGNAKQNNGNGNNQQQQQSGKQNNQKQQQDNRPKSLLELLAGAKVILH